MFCVLEAKLSLDSIYNKYVLEYLLEGGGGGGGQYIIP